MDNLTHTLTAAALSHAGLNRKTRFATLAVIAGANLPDADVITWARGTATYLCYHRGITHSLPGIVTLGVVGGLATYYLGRRAGPDKRGLTANRGWLIACALAGTASHLLLDFTNAYGVRPFLPFSGKWYAWDIMFIVDPVVLLLLMAGLGIPALLRLISEEVGSAKPAYRAGAIFSLVALCGVWGLRDASHRRALALLDSVQFGQENPQRIGAFPSPANPLAWVGVAETDSAFYVVNVRTTENQLNTSGAQIFRKPEASPALEAAKNTFTGRTFLGFARFPWGQVEPTDNGYTVLLRDLRFAMPGAARPGFVVQVEMNKEFQVRSETFNFTFQRPAHAADVPSPD